MTLQKTAIALALTISAAVAMAVTPPEQVPPPNIVVIMLDDMAAADIAYMPIVQARLVAVGTTFTEFFDPQPTCCPSRASFLLGNYPHNTGIRDNAPPGGGFEGMYASGRELDVFPRQLFNEGYRTMLSGKYFNGYPATADSVYVPPGWSEWYAFDGTDYLGYDLVEFADTGGPAVRVRHNNTTRWDPVNQTSGQYSTDILRNFVLRFIKKSVAAEQPFFAWYTPYAPHAPQTKAARHATITDTLPKGPSFNEADVSDKPTFIKSKALLDADKISSYQAQWRGRMTSLKAADEAVGMILDTLDAYGQTENTYVIFLSDNGYLIGQHRIQPSKRWPYEEAIRLPLVIKGPGVPVGTNSDWLLMNDLMPTILQLVGLPIPLGLDGTSFAPVLRGQSLPSPRTAFLVENAFVGSEGIPVYKGIRTVINDTIWKYVYWGPTTKELYNLTTDPFELQSRHKTADSTRIPLLHARTLSLQACAALLCWAAERE